MKIVSFLYVWKCYFHTECNLNFRLEYQLYIEEIKILLVDCVGKFYHLKIAYVITFSNKLNLAFKNINVQTNISEQNEFLE